MSNQYKHKHGREQFFIEGEGPTPSALPSSRLHGAAEAVVPQPADHDRQFRFCRIIHRPKFQPNDEGLIALGQALVDPFVPGAVDSKIPAGFTYFGQFVDHDITFDRTQGIPAGELDPAEIENGRTPALELDSVYGRGPDASPELYETDKVRLKIGTTTGRDIFGVTQAFPNDLPRKPLNDPDAKRAIIGDPRNDENLIVAQTHLAFLKFHNKVVEQLKAQGTAQGQLFDNARKVVVQHYQSIVLHDFVPRIVEASALQAVRGGKRKKFVPDGVPRCKRPCMPIEFSVAAYRLGHSMIRGAYQWNRVFNSNGKFQGVPTLDLFFLFAKGADVSDLGGSPSLPSDWIVDWRRMYDFSEQAGGARHPQLNFARLIDTKLVKGLQTLPEFANAPAEHLKSLAARNLLRGRLVGLPTGQDVADELGLPVLSPAEIATGNETAVVVERGFHDKTPLWYYILKEAEVKQAGERLGPVGSFLVAETFHGLIEASDHSIVKEKGWKPALPAQDPQRFTMLDLLKFVGDINPLGD